MRVPSSLYAPDEVPFLKPKPDLSCALAVICFSAAFEPWLRGLVRADVAVILLEAACAAGFVITALSIDPALSAAPAAKASAMRLLAGDLAFAWWGGLVLAGMVAPLVIELLMLRRARALAPYSLQALLPALCAFVGGFSLRYCVVMAGMHPALGF